MKIVQHTVSDAMAQHYYNVSVYPMSTAVSNHIKSLLQPGTTAILYSGGWRLDFDAEYLELNTYQTLNIPNIPKKTYFIDPKNTESIHKVLCKIDAKNVLFLHSAWICNYQSLDKVIASTDKFLLYGAQIILSVPAIRTDFNRLKYSCADIAQQYSAEYVDDSFIIKRNR